ncbi:MAG: hypothetical protein JW821_00350 [Deltaproteobacteria bacterium]|nr:hypothetical protein [Deltaproteobacteria bacterium]
MGEIRSTMDIIMERARGLTMTEEEKREVREREMGASVKGLVQKYLDGARDMDGVRTEAVALQARDRDLTERLLRGEILGRMAPEGENLALLNLLEEVLGMDTGPLKAVVAEAKRETEKSREAAVRDLLKRLAKRGISGSAVLPNLDSDPEWKRLNSELKRRFSEKIASL